MLAGRLDPSAPNDVLISIPPSSYMEYSPIAKLYTSRIYFTESQGGVLGANAMIGHDVLFDWEHGRVGFAKSTCEHPDEEEKLEAEKATEPASTDCTLSKETLTQICVESLNVEQCRKYPVSEIVVVVRHGLVIRRWCLTSTLPHATLESSPSRLRNMVHGCNRSWYTVWHVLRASCIDKSYRKRTRKVYNFVQ